VISSGVFVERASTMASVELVCEGGAEAVMTAKGWLLARPNSSDQVPHCFMQSLKNPSQLL
jgi:hypothetical protein